jgi:hypothetical protein
VLLNALEQIEGGARACAVPLGLQTHPHDTVEHQGEKADQCMGADAIGEPVVNRRDLDV